MSQLAVNTDQSVIKSLSNDVISISDLVTENSYDRYNFKNVELTNCEFIKSIMTYMKAKYSIWINCVFDSVDFSFSNLSYAKFINCKFINCTYTLCNFDRTSFVKCKFMNDKILNEYLKFTHMIDTTIDVDLKYINNYMNHMDNYSPMINAMLSLMHQKAYPLHYVQLTEHGKNNIHR